MFYFERIFTENIENPVTGRQDRLRFVVKDGVPYVIMKEFPEFLGYKQWHSVKNFIAKIGENKACNLITVKNRRGDVIFDGFALPYEKAKKFIDSRIFKRKKITDKEAQQLKRSLQTAFEIIIERYENEIEKKYVSTNNAKYKQCAEILNELLEEIEKTPDFVEKRSLARCVRTTIALVERF